ncbi:hypothetical protein QBC39DRAFT_284165, partial [Podospora conica]
MSRSRRAGALDTGASSQQVGSDDGVQGSNVRREDTLTATASRKRCCDEGYRLRCPFRARNKLRFNVRDYPGCALFSFPAMTDVRQHIKAQHRRPDPDPGMFPCDRCKVEFPTKAEQQEHSKQIEPCSPRPFDPEDGVDDDTVTRIFNRPRMSSRHPEEDWGFIQVKYAQLWSLIFPDAQVPDHRYHVVLEDTDFELEYTSLLSTFVDDFRTRFGPSDDTLSNLSDSLLDYLNMAARRCRTKAKNMPHHNRRCTEHLRAKRENNLPAAHRGSAIGTDT